MWEFSSDVLNFPREVGGEVIFESEKAGDAVDWRTEGDEEDCSGEFYDQEDAVGDNWVTARHRA